MKVFELIFDDEILLSKKQKEIEVKKIEIDESRLSQGDLFFDLKGDKDLNKLLKKAAMVIRFGQNKNVCKKVVETPDPRKLFSLASKRFYGSCCDKLKIIGITGTNGKSSTVKLVYDALSFMGKRVASIGTMGARFLNLSIETGFTTPDPHILHSLFYKMYKEGVEYVVMEVSAHAIALKKLEGIKFLTLAITNITEDHLDFFKTMENYAQTKLDFVNKDHAMQAVVCVDDDRILKHQFSLPYISYGLNTPSDVFAIDIKTEFSGTTFTLNCLDEVCKVKTFLCGEYNVLNCLCAISILRLLGFPIKNIVSALSVSQPEEGRFNVITFQGINIIIDYAHTPDGLFNVLKTARALSPNRLIVLFGAGGNRDKEKRPIMGRIAEQQSDFIFLTSDNPRMEDPDEIICEIKKGIKGNNFKAIINRKEAIKEALNFCREGDCLIIAGKGGEKYQDIMGQKLSYSDFDEVYNYFRKNITLIE